MQKIVTNTDPFWFSTTGNTNICDFAESRNLYKIEALVLHHALENTVRLHIIVFLAASHIISCLFEQELIHSPS